MSLTITKNLEKSIKTRHRLLDETLTADWNRIQPSSQKLFYELWYWKFVDPVSQVGFCINFHLSSNRRHAAQATSDLNYTGEVSALLFNGDETVVGAQQLFQSDLCSILDPNNIQIGSCSFSPEGSKGKLIPQVQGQPSIEWDIQIEKRSHEYSFNLIPPLLILLGLVKNRAVTPFLNVGATGTLRLGSKELELKTLSLNNAHGMLGHASGPRNGHSWIWGHSNYFLDEAGTSVDLVFEGLTARAWLIGSVPTPALSTFCIVYLGEQIRFTSLRGLFSNRAQMNKENLWTWTFTATQGEWRLRGKMSANPNSFAHFEMADTDESFIHYHESRFADLEIEIFKSQKLLGRFFCPKVAAFETVERKHDQSIKSAFESGPF